MPLVTVFARTDVEHGGRSYVPGEAIETGAVDAIRLITRGVAGTTRPRQPMLPRPQVYKRRDLVSDRGPECDLGCDPGQEGPPGVPVSPPKPKRVYRRRNLTAKAE